MKYFLYHQCEMRQMGTKAITQTTDGTREELGTRLAPLGQYLLYHAHQIVDYKVGQVVDGHSRVAYSLILIPMLPLQLLPSPTFLRYQKALFWIGLTTTTATRNANLHLLTASSNRSLQPVPNHRLQPLIPRLLLIKRAIVMVI